MEGGGGRGGGKGGRKGRRQRERVPGSGGSESERKRGLERKGGEEREGGRGRERKMECLLSELIHGLDNLKGRVVW
jgi:hypothetical protein